MAALGEPHCESYCVDIDRNGSGHDDVVDICNSSVSTHSMRADSDSSTGNCSIKYSRGTELQRKLPSVEGSRHLESERGFFFFFDFRDVIFNA